MRTSHLAAQGQPAGHGFGQEEGHVNVGQVHQIEHLAATADDFAGLGNAVLHAAAAGGHEGAVVDVGLDARHGGLRCGDGCARTGYLGARRRDGGLCGFGLCPGGHHGRLQAALAGAVVVHFLVGRGAFAHQRLRAGQAPLCRIQFALPLCHEGECCLAVALAHGHLGFGVGHGGHGLLVPRLGLVV